MWSVERLDGHIVSNGGRRRADPDLLCIPCRSSSGLNLLALCKAAYLIDGQRLSLLSPPPRCIPSPAV